MARLESAPIAVRSTAFSGGRAAFGGSIEAKFGPPLLKIGFSSTPTPSVRALDSLPLRNKQSLIPRMLENNIPERRSDSGAVKPGFRILGRIGNGLIELGRDPGQSFVNWTIKFEPPAESLLKSAPVKVENKVVAPEAKKVAQVKEAAKTETPDQVKMEVRPVAREVKSVRSLGVVERAQIEMKIRQVRARMLRPRTQAIAMVDSEALVWAQSTPALVKENKIVEPRVQTEIGKEIEAPVPQTAGRVKNYSSRGLWRLIVYSQEKAVEDDKTNRTRIEALKKARDEFKLMGQGDLRDKIVEKADLINGAIYKSQILFQSGLEWKRDGTQRRFGNRLVSGKGELTDGEIEKTAKEETAVRRDAKGVEVERRKLENVMKLPEEPFSYFNEEVILPKRKEVKEVRSDERVFPGNLKTEPEIKTGEGEVEVEVGSVPVLNNPSFVQQLDHLRYIINPILQLKTFSFEPEEKELSLV